MPKILFIDIDGTLYDHGEFDGIPDSAKTAIDLARKNGHKVIVCTGRVRSSVNQDVLDVGFDGCVFGAGCDVSIHENQLFYHSLAHEIIEKSIAFFKANDIGFTLEGDQASFLDEISKNRFHAMLLKRNGYEKNSEMAAAFLKQAMMHDYSEFDINQNAINKISFNAPTYESIELMKQELGEHFKCLVHGEHEDLINGECIPLNISKASGMDHILEYFQADVKDTMAYGDSVNDEEMIIHAGIGVAMGNAHDSLKAVADDICENVENDAIYHSFKKYGLI